MSFFGNLFERGKKAESVAFVEIGPDSIAGGLAYFKEGEMPFVVYANRMPIVLVLHEDPPASMTRTLNMLGEQLIREGAPALLRVAGDGHINSVLVSIKAPWQETNIRSEKIERTEPFTFTRTLFNTALAKSAVAPPGRLLADEFVISTLLDGYEVKHPIGKRARHVNITILSSFVDQRFSESIAESLRKLFHTKSIRLIAAAALRYEALRILFPLEREYLMVDIAGDAVVTGLVRGGSLAAVEHGVASVSANQKDPWLDALKITFETITKRYPLPRKVFLIAGDADRPIFKEKVKTELFASLRLSQDPLIVIPVAPSHLTDEIKLADAVRADLGLEFMVLFLHHVHQ